MPAAFASRLFALLATVGLLLAAAPARAASYTLFALPESFGSTEPRARNAVGDVTGYWEDGAFYGHGFLRRASGEIVKFDLPGGSPRAQTLPMAISDDGRIGGSYSDTDANGQLTVQVGFRRAADGSFSTFAVPGAQGTVVTAGNRVGDLTGYFTVAGVSGTQGFIAPAAGGIVVFGSGNGQVLLPTSINDLGEVAGTLDYDHGFLRDAGGTLQVFAAPVKRGTPGTPEMSMRAVDNAGTVVGSADSHYCADLFHCYALNLRAVVRRRDGSLSEFQVFARPTVATSINAGGTIAGSYYATGIGDNAPPSGFIRSADGQVTSYRVPNMLRTFGGLIGDDGVVLGICSDRSGQRWGYLRMP